MDVRSHKSIASYTKLHSYRLVQTLHATSVLVLLLGWGDYPCPIIPVFPRPFPPAFQKLQQ